MTTQINAWMSAGILGATLTLASSGLVQADEQSTSAVADDTTTTWEITKRSRPPFQRRAVEREVVDVAAMEPVAAMETEVVWVVDRSGKPPYRRQRLEVPVIDAASLETTESATPGTVFRGRPPFRRNVY